MQQAIGTVWRSAAVLIVVLVAADLAGVIICTLFDVAPIRAKSAVLPDAIWLVLGIFAGFFAYGFAGSWAGPEMEEGAEWSSSPDAGRIGGIIVATCGIITASLMFAFYKIYWSRGVGSEFFVPDSAPHSIVFFLSVFGAIAGAHFLLRPASPASA